MAKQSRTLRTVPYFPFYVKDGRTLYVLKKKYGIAGIGIFTELFRFLSDTPDHWYVIQDEFDRSRLWDFMGCTEEEGYDWIDTLAYTGKIDKDLWDNYRAIASEDFLASVKSAYDKRSESCITIEEIRETVADLYDPVINEFQETPDPEEDREESDEPEIFIECGPEEAEEPDTTEPEPARTDPGESRGNPGADLNRDGGRLEEGGYRSGHILNNTIQNKTSNMGPPSAAPPPASLSDPPDDDLYRNIQEAFLSKQPAMRFTNYGKEGKAIKDLIKKARGQSPDNPAGFIHAMLEVFYRLRRSGDRFWRGQPFLPSALNSSGIFDRVLDQLAESQGDEEIEELLEEVPL